MLNEIGLTDYYFKELVTKKPEYLVLLINGICNLNLKKEEIVFGTTEERDTITFKTVSYDVKVVSQNMNIDIEAQINLVSKNINEYGDYSYDINRAIYYLSMLHSRSYNYREKGYDEKKSIVIFLYQYDIAGEDVIQKINLHNKKRDIEYDNLNLYMVSIAKIKENSKIELERALKLLVEKDIDSYKEDESNVIKEAAEMLDGYDKSEIAMMKRDARLKEEYENGIRELAAREEGKAEGLQEGLEKGKVEGSKETLDNNIKTMKSNGFDNETIAKALNLDIKYVNEVLKNKNWYFYD